MRLPPQSPRSRRRVVRTNTTSTSDDTPVGEGSLEGGVERKMTDEELALLLHHELNATHVRRRTREQRGAGEHAARGCWRGDSRNPDGALRVPAMLG